MVCYPPLLVDDELEVVGAGEDVNLRDPHFRLGAGNIKCTLVFMAPWDGHGTKAGNEMVLDANMCACDWGRQNI